MQYAFGPWTTGGVYLNFAERPKDGRALFGSADTFDRLREVKAAYDAGDVIRSNHPVKPATATTLVADPLRLARATARARAG